MKNNANALSYGIIAGVISFIIGDLSPILVTNVLLGFIAGKLMDSK